jgi:peptidoglycan/LPS O-acetylase OafA/YrhL
MQGIPGSEATELQRASTIPTLDGWRAIAILGVVLCHASDAPLLAREGPGGFWHTLTRYGAEGVALFFGLSGFLITYRLLQERQRTGAISLRAFYGRRAFRILPACLAFLLAVSALAALGVLAIHPAELRSAFLFYRNYLVPNELGGWYTGHFWTLAIEEHFYLLWPGLLVWLGPRRALRVAAALAVAVAAWRWVEIRFHPTAAWFPELGRSTRTDVRMDGLMWGAFAALLLHDGVRERWLRRVYASRLTWGALAVGAGVCLHGSLLPWNAMWWGLLIPFLIVGTVLRPTGWLGRLLESPVLGWLGRLSYSLYLWQQLFLVGASVERPLPLGALQVLPLNLVGAFGCAALSYYALERPLVRVGKRLFSAGEPGDRPVTASVPPAG